ncbi:YihY/virulence factor BrkB family protein [Kitasatospora sp. NBC_01287]|uniref:YhjD/YihY/BrkB family envelope integrity protein n=1 Tax=Kitasatospora sp. NBC_01287 TaxID=2903573 RepID=UPI002253F87C|nr:YhjD/YihY/BrkB family envelope integrity protein [Kitasatospora sp. NBC_01287]MCX4744369.1 YihY/virulence factor BrkB family protein [Kitasatospora sp. NBC_01287]
MTAVSARARTERRLPVLTTLTERLVTANVLDSATRLAAQLFLTTVPLLFALAAFAPQSVRDQMLDSLREVFGLSGNAAQQLRDLASGGTHDEELRETTGLIGALMAVLSATSCSRAMTRTCQRAWRLPNAPVRLTAWRWLAWVLSWLAILILQGPLRSGFGVGLWLGVPVTFVVSTCVWWWTQHLLLAARKPWLPLLPAALLTAACTSALSLTARLYMSRALNRSLAEYGSLGLVLTILTWLIVFCTTITVTITAGAVLAQEPPLNQLLGVEQLPPAPREGGS